VRGNTCRGGARGRCLIGGKQLGGEQVVAPSCETDFEIFTKMPLASFCKLLTNFLKKLKKLQKQKLLKFSNPRTFLIKTFSNSA
jgi:hypothetical protein